jgi:hypothetical protein
MSYLFNAPTVSLDAFARQRISNPFTLGDYKHIYGLDDNFLDYTVNGGSVAYQPNAACARLSTTSNSASRVVHQSKFYHHYMPGKSQLILSSFNFYGATANVRKRTGYFDDNNGVFFEQDGAGVLSFTVRSYVSGAPADTKIVQSVWNHDKCDGTGPSGWDLDITKTQLFFMDFQWLGVGLVRCGFVHEDRFIVAHEFYHSDLLPTVYMSTPNLPIRCEMLNYGTTTGAYMDQICSTVISEGGYVEAGQDWAQTSPSLRSIAAGATLPVLAIRLATTFKTYTNRIIVRAHNLSLVSTGSTIEYKLIKAPSSAQLTGNTWVDVNTNSGVQYNATATAYTDGSVIDAGYVSASTAGSKATSGSSPANPASTAKKNFIVQNYDASDSEIYIVVAKNIGTDATTVGASIQWREIY